MVAVLVILTIAVFLAVDLGIRLALKKAEQKRLLLEREVALDTGLRLEFADEALSLKRVEVAVPRPRFWRSTMSPSFSTVFGRSWSWQGTTSIRSRPVRRLSACSGNTTTISFLPI